MRSAKVMSKRLRVSRSKTAYLVVSPSGQQGALNFKLEGKPLPSVSNFKYLWSVLDANVECGNYVGRIIAA